jgi:hypothetical protein
MAGAIRIKLDTVGLINTYIDPTIQVSQYLEMAYNNTYNLPRISEHDYRNGKANFTQKGGCRDQISACQDLAAVYDPADLANNASTNSVCLSAYDFCATNIQLHYNKTFVSGFH